MSYHPLQKVVPAVLLDMEPVVAGAQPAAGLQRRMRQCCRGLPSAPLLQLLDELLREGRVADFYIQFWKHKQALNVCTGCRIPGACSSLRPKAEITFLLTSSWFFNGSKADMLAALTGVACFIVGSAATTLPSRPSIDSRIPNKNNV